MPLKITSIRIPNLWNNETSFTLLETINAQMTDVHAEDLPVSGEDDQFLDESSRLQLVHSNVQRIFSFAMIRYEEDTLRQLMDGIIQNSLKKLLKTAAK